MLEEKDFQNIPNLRDLHLCADNIQPNQFVRSAALDNATEQDMQNLAANGVHTVIDLRTEVEVNAKPDKSNPAIDDINIPVLEKDLTDPTGLNPTIVTDDLNKPDWGLEMMFNAYETMTHSSYSQDHIKLILDTVLKKRAEHNNQGIILFHCTAGKDRTGVICWLIEAIVNTSFNDRKSDYLLTNEMLNYLREDFVNQAKANGADDTVVDNLNHLHSVHPEYMEHADFYQANLTDMYKYIGIDQAMINDLRKSILTE